MIKRIRRGATWLFSVRYPYTHELDRQRARYMLLLYSITLMMVAMDFVFVSVSELDWVSLLIDLFAVALVMLSYFLLQRGRLRLASGTIILTGWFIVVLSFFWGGLDVFTALSLSLLFTLTSTLFGTQMLMLMTGLSMAVFLLSGLLRAEGILAPAVPASPSDWIFGFPVLLAQVVTLWYFSRGRDTSLNQAQDAVERLQSVLQVGEAAASTIDLYAMPEQVVDLIRELFDLVHVSVYLVDEENEAQLVLWAGASDAAERLLDRGHRLELKENNPVGYAAVRRESILTEAASGSLFPGARWGMALPLEVGGRIIGVLDLQSTEAFPEADQEAFRVMAGQLAVAVESAQLFARQSQRAAESEAMLREARANLREIERLNRQLTRQAWDEHLRSRGQDVIGITLQDSQPRVDTAWTPGMTLAAQKRRPVLSMQGGKPLLAVPVLLRDEVIGAVELESDLDVESGDAMEVAQAVAARLALTVDNARLVDYSQRLADRELQVGEVAAKLQAQTTVDDMLETAVTELGRLLDADRASIRLGLRHTESTVFAPQPLNGGDGTQ